MLQRTLQQLITQKRTPPSNMMKVSAIFFARIGGLGAGLCVIDKSLSKAHVIVLSYYNNTVTIDD